MGKHKRKRSLADTVAISKKPKIQKSNVSKNKKNVTKYERLPQPNQSLEDISSIESRTLNHPILSAYFRTLLTLRQYLSLAIGSAKSTSTSLISRKQRLLGFKSNGTILENEVARLLDTTLVGMIDSIHDIDGKDPFVEQAITEKLAATQDEVVASSQEELLECAISIVLLKARRQRVWATSVLAAGYRAAESSSRQKIVHHFHQFGLDVVSKESNPHVAEFRREPWEYITNIVGQETMLKLLSMQGDQEGAAFFPLQESFPEKNAILKSTPKSFQQFLGSAISEIQLEKKVERIKSTSTDTEIKVNISFARKPKLTGSVVRTPKDIRFVRSRMFYAKPANNKHAEPKTGLPHIHVLNRYHDHTKRHHKVHVLKYIFPKAFSLHNVFTSILDRRETVQDFKDYTLREEEIDNEISKEKNDRRLRKVLKKDIVEMASGCPDDDDELHHGYVPMPSPLPDIGKKERNAYEAIENIPQRFRGRILDIVGEIIRLQRRCKYHPLLQHYCPSSIINPNIPDPRPKIPMLPENHNSPVATFAFKSQFSRQTISMTPKAKKLTQQSVGPIASSKTQRVLEADPKDPMLCHMTTPHQVYTFLRAVLGNIIPMEAWGAGKAALANRENLFSNLEKFVKLRRYESMTLHEVLQGLKLRELEWLYQTPKSQNPKTRLDAADMKQCASLLAEFIYYVFDSLVIPLIKAHFYVTESTTDRHKTCYFRHDVWRKLCSSHLNRITSTMFTEIPTNRANLVMQRRSLKFSNFRLLPKATGARVISNLTRRPMELDRRTGRRSLGKSINQILKPNHVALTFEKCRQPQALGSSLFTVNEILPRLIELKRRLNSQGTPGNKKLYFVKVDVTSCFDTIPQEHLLSVVENFYMEEKYKIRRQGRVMVGNGKAGQAKPKILFPQVGEPWNNHVPPIEQSRNFVKGSGAENKSLIFVDRVASTHYDRDILINELREHIANNFVQIGKRFYRQSVGIPQGSVMSTLLCNIFYGDLEAKELPFTQSQTGLLMRLIDDFLFITTNRDHAQRFADAMHKGFPEYGVSIKPEKSIVNFEYDFRGKKIERVIGDSWFPYCGTLINTKTLEIKRDWARRDGATVSNLLTVDHGVKPGQKMLDKILSGWKMVSTATYLNTEFNSKQTVVANLYWSFVDTGMKFYRYYRTVSPHGKVNEKQILGIIEEFIALAYSLMLSRSRREYGSNGTAKAETISRSQIRWLVATAFLRVLSKKQTLFPMVINWLADCIKRNDDEVDEIFHQAVEDEDISEIFDSMKY